MAAVLGSANTTGSALNTYGSICGFTLSRYYGNSEYATGYKMVTPYAYVDKTY